MGNIVKAKSKKINTGFIPVENFKGILGYICDSLKRSIRLSKCLKEELTEIFGEHNTRFRGEFFYYVWIVEFEGETFSIFTASGKGTQFSILAKYEEDKSGVCEKFLKEMEMLLKNLKQKE
jgi:hypothetical protein